MCKMYLAITTAPGMAIMPYIQFHSGELVADRIQVSIRKLLKNRNLSVCGSAAHTQIANSSEFSDRFKP